MPEHIFTVVARGLSTDVQSNSLTVFSILEELGTVPSFPAVVPEVSVVTLWRRMPGDEGIAFAQRMRFIDPSGNEVAHADQTFRFEKLRHRVMTSVRMVPIRMSGCHRFEILLRRDDAQPWGNTVASYPVEVLHAEEQEASTLLEDDQSSTG